MITTNVNGTYKEIDEVWARVGNDYKEIIKVWDSSDSKWVYEAVGTVTGTLPLTAHADGTVDYKIYGDTVQADTPTPSDPAEVVGVGVRTENLFDMRESSQGVGYQANSIMTSTATTTTPNFFISEYIPVTANNVYSYYTDIFRTSIGYLKFYNIINDTVTYIAGELQNEAGSFTVPSNATHMRINVDKMATKFEIVEGSTAPTTYIPYGYKLPMVSRTENLLNPNEMDSGYYISSGDSKLQNNNWNLYYVSVTPSSVYAAINLSPNVSSAYIGVCDKNKNVINHISGAVSSAEKIIEVPENCYYLAVSVRINAVNPMVVEDSTAPTSYIPYHRTETPIYIGDEPLYEDEYISYSEQKVYRRTENLFDKNATDITKGYINNGYIDSNGSAIGQTMYRATEYIKIVGGKTYTLKDMNINANLASICFYTASSAATYISGIAYNFRSEITFEAPANAEYLRFSYLFANSDIAMLTEGSTALTSYIPYLQPEDPPVPLPALPTFSDADTVFDYDETPAPSNVEIEFKKGW